MRTLDIEFERDRSIGLGSTFGDGIKERQTDTYIDFFQKHFLGCASDIDSKFIKKTRS